MIEALLSTYSSFFRIFGIAFDAPRNFYRGIVSDIDLKSLLGFYVQVILATIAFNAIVFPSSAGAECGALSTFWYTIGALNVFVSATVFSLVFWISLRLTRVPAAFSDVAKFTFVMYIFMSIFDLIIGAISAYAIYIPASYFASITDINAGTSAAENSLYIVSSVVVPITLMVIFTALLFVSTGKSFRILGSFIAAWLCQVVVVRTVLGTLWWMVLSTNFEQICP